MYLHDDSLLFSQLVSRTADYRGIPEAYVVKDYFVVAFLRKATLANPSLVFKGGTCLSKCYQAIDRFSEDIDLGLRSSHATEGMRKSLKRTVVEATGTLGMVIDNLDRTRSRREFNRFVVSIPAGLNSNEEDKILIETAVVTPADPAEYRSLQSFIGEYCAAEGFDDVIKEYDLAPFEMLANSLERTFCDKVFALCDYYLSGDILSRQSRHVYDLYKLLDRVTCNDDLVRLMGTVREQRRGVFRCLSAEPDVCVPDVLEEIVRKEVYRKDYERVTMPLLYEDVLYDEASGALDAVERFLREAGW